LNKNESYQDAKSEKMTRGSFLSEVERLVRGDSVVILDSLNYIKGFRYEVFCRARTQKTPTCVIHCDVPKDITRDRNANLDKTNQWESSLFNELSQRFEIPNPKNKWDRPLFTLTQDDKTPLEDIKMVLFETEEKYSRHVATEADKVEEPNFVYEMDQVTKAIINALLESQGNGFLGELKVPSSSQKVSLKRNTSIAELNRLRRQFIKMQTNLLTKQPVTTIGDSFVVYLNSNLDS